MDSPGSARWRRPLLLSLMGAVLLVAACGGDEKDDGTAPGSVTRGPEILIVIPAGKPIVIGFSAALTGPIGARGTEYRDATVTGVERWKAANGNLIGGHRIVVHAEDDGCSEPGLAAIAAERLLAQPGLVGVIGPQCSGGAIQAIPIFSAAGVVAISGSATTTNLTTDQDAGRFFFRTAYRNDLEGALIGQYLAGLDVETHYFVDDGSTYAVDLIDAATAIAARFGVTVNRIQVTPGQVDFSQEAETIASADPGFVGYAGFNPDAVLFFRQLRDAGYNGPFGAGDAAASLRGFVEPLGQLAENVLFAGCSPTLSSGFLSDFEGHHGYSPTAAFPAHYADAVTVLLNAISKVAVESSDGSLTIDPSELRDAVRAESLAEGESGPVFFDIFGDRVPSAGDLAGQLIVQGFAEQDNSVFISLGLQACQVQDGALVNLLDTGAEIR